MATAMSFVCWSVCHDLDYHSVLCGMLRCGLGQGPSTWTRTVFRHTRFCWRKQLFLGNLALARLLKALKGLMRSGVRAPRSGSPGSASCSWHSRLFAPESLRSICTRCVFASSSSSFQQSTLPPPSHSPSGKWTKPLKLPFDASGSLCRPKRKERILYREHIVSRARSVK